MDGSHFVDMVYQWTSTSVMQVCVNHQDILFTSFPCPSFSLCLCLSVCLSVSLSPSPPLSLSLPLSLPPSLPPSLPLSTPHTPLCLLCGDNHLESLFSNWHALAPLPLECFLFWHQLPSKCSKHHFKSVPCRVHPHLQSKSVTFAIFLLVEVYISPRIVEHIPCMAYVYNGPLHVHNRDNTVGSTIVHVCMKTL